MTNENENFSIAYNGLKEAVEKLRNSKEEDIDTLFESVENAFKFRKECIKRLNIIKQIMADKTGQEEEI